LGCSARRHPKVCTAASPHGLTSRLSGQGHRQVVINDLRSHFIRGVIPPLLLVTVRHDRRPVTDALRSA